VNINQAFPSKYFKADDFAPGESRALIIAECKMEVVGQEGEKATRPVLYFSNAEHGLVLNQTRAGVIAAALGTETDAWVGQTIYLQRGQTRLGNKIVPCTDVIVPPPPQPRARVTAPYNHPGPGPAPHVATAGIVQRQGRPVPPPVQSEEDYGHDPLA
jgi:hypothetical protein